MTLSTYQTDPYWINPVKIVQRYIGHMSWLNRRGLVSKGTTQIKYFRPTFDAYAASAFLVGHNLIIGGQMSEEISYVQRNPATLNQPQEAPDFFGLLYTPHTKPVKAYITGIEVFEYTSESQFSLRDELIKKLRKQYAEDTTLVCHITSDDFHSSLETLEADMKDLGPTSSLQLLLISTRKDNGNILLTWVYPTFRTLELDVLKIMNIKVPDPLVFRPKRDIGQPLPNVPFTVTSDLRILPSIMLRKNDTLWSGWFS